MSEKNFNYGFVNEYLKRARFHDLLMAYTTNITNHLCTLRGGVADVVYFYLITDSRIVSRELPIQFRFLVQWAGNQANLTMKVGIGQFNIGEAVNTNNLINNADIVVTGANAGLFLQISPATIPANAITKDLVAIIFSRNSVAGQNLNVYFCTALQIK